MTEKTKGNSPIAEKTKLELAKEAQIEVEETMITKTIEYLEAYKEFKGIGGAVNVETTVLRVAEHFGEIPLLFLQTVTQEALLSKALKKLQQEGKLEKSGKKGDVRVKFVKAE